MSYNPPPHQGHYPPPPYYPGAPPPSGHGYPPPPSGHGHPPPPPHHPHYPYYVPGTIMMPVPMGYPPPPAPESAPEQQTPTYITNYHYHGTQPVDPAAVMPPPPTAFMPPSSAIHLVEADMDWVPATSTTASHLAYKAVIAGHEGWDGSPLWVIRARHEGDLVPGKLSAKHNSAYIPFAGKEVQVQHIEVLCARSDVIQWIPSTNGNVPPNAIVAGNTVNAEPLYVGRAKYQLSLTPGKIHPSHGCCYISFGGNEIPHKMYDVLCRV